MAHTISDKSKLLARVRRIKGQAAALEKLLDAESDCLTILQQSAAIRGAVNGLIAALIEGHLEEHLVHEPRLEQRERDLEVVVQVVKSYLK